MEKDQYILFYSINKRNEFTSFLPLDLKDDKDKTLFDFLSDPKRDNFSNDDVFKLPIEKKRYDYLNELEVKNFPNQDPSDFFKKHHLEEWVL